MAFIRNSLRDFDDRTIGKGGTYAKPGELFAAEIGRAGV